MRSFIISTLFALLFVSVCNAQVYQSQTLTVQSVFGTSGGPALFDQDGNAIVVNPAVGVAGYGNYNTAAVFGVRNNGFGVRSNNVIFANNGYTGFNGGFANTNAVFVNRNRVFVNSPTVTFSGRGVNTTFFAPANNRVFIFR
jgi:hypothetical protein